MEFALSSWVINVLYRLLANVLPPTFIIFSFSLWLPIHRGRVRVRW